MMDSSLMTSSSLLMAAMLRPVPAERKAVLDTRLLPGRAFRMLLAVSLGSAAGLFSWKRAAEVAKEVDAGAMVRIGRVGRAERAAPMAPFAIREAIVLEVSE